MKHAGFRLAWSLEWELGVALILVRNAILDVALGLASSVTPG